MVPLGPDYEDPPVDPCAAMSCEPGTHCVEGECVADDPCALVSCDRGQVCLDGECVDDVLDEDGDGSPASHDCNDHDPEIRPGVTRPCQTRCGEGLETCAGPDWSECSAPLDCQCEPGEQRDEDCGLCGTARRRCSPQGVWEGLGECQGQGECQPREPADEACGNCGSRRRTCDAQCRWNDWGACVGGGVCNPGDTEQVDCGPCLLGTAERWCSDTCHWDPPGPCLLDVDVCIPGSMKWELCDECSVVEEVCPGDCRWDGNGECTSLACKPGDTETRDCPCEGVETRICPDEGCFAPWSGCDTDASLCPELGLQVECERGCGQQTCTDYCFDDCSVDCHCEDRDTGEVSCPGDQWDVPDGCGDGIPMRRSCTDACLLTGTCPADGL